MGVPTKVIISAVLKGLTGTILHAVWIIILSELSPNGPKLISRNNHEKHRNICCLPAWNPSPQCCLETNKRVPHLCLLQTISDSTDKLSSHLESSYVHLEIYRANFYQNILETVQISLPLFKL